MMGDCVLRALNSHFYVAIVAGCVLLAGSPLLAQTDPAMIVTPAGKVGIGVTGTSQQLDVQGFDAGEGGLNVKGAGINFAAIPLSNGEIYLTSDASSQASGQGRIIFRTWNSGYSTRVQVRPSNPILLVSGNVQATGYQTVSSRRWKADVQALASPIEKVMQLRGVTYQWDVEKATAEGLEIAGMASGRQVGLIAEEVAQVVPEAVGYEADGTTVRSVDYSRLVPVLLEAVKAQQRQIEALEAKVQALSN